MLCFVLKDSQLGYFTSEGIFSDNLLDSKFFGEENIIYSKYEELKALGHSLEIKKLCLLGQP
mgnify:CR=1 FL=1